MIFRILSQHCYEFMVFISVDGIKMMTQRKNYATIQYSYTLGKTGPVKYYKIHTTIHNI